MNAVRTASRRINRSKLGSSLGGRVGMAGVLNLPGIHVENRD